MAEDWDLSAIVRSCQSATNTATTESTPPTNTISTQDTTSSLATSIAKEEYDSFSFPNLVQPITNEFQELNQLFAPLKPTTNTTTTCGLGIKPNSPFSEFAGSIGQQEEKTQQSEHLPMLAPAATIHTTIWSHFEPEASTSGFNRFHHHHQQQQQHVQQQQNQLQLVQKQESLVPQISSSAIVLPNTQPQTPRSRKRKSEQKKMVCQVTADKLSTDLWAWRKYGQKPIKGSPYPRNYYRCSSSKGCAARKQVERSNAEADMYIVTYTGDHLHPRPTHRNSLTGTTRSKSPTRNPPPATHGSSGSLSIEPNTSSSFSAPAQSPMMPSADPPENDVAEEESETESPDPEIETDVDTGGDVDIFPPTPEALPRNILLGLGHFYGANGGGADASSPKSQPGSNLG